MRRFAIFKNLPSRYLVLPSFADRPKKKKLIRRFLFFSSAERAAEDGARDGAGAAGAGRARRRGAPRGRIAAVGRHRRRRPAVGPSPVRGLGLAAQGLHARTRVPSGTFNLKKLTPFDLWSF